ncbi:MAG: DUF3263 domain-containing protein [Frankiaceae bacterium]|jgi:hypothetical protein
MTDGHRRAGRPAKRFDVDRFAGDVECGMTVAAAARTQGVSARTAQRRLVAAGLTTPRPRAAVAAHGTAHRYGQGCRCGECRAANTARCRDSRVRSRGPRSADELAAALRQASSLGAVEHLLLHAAQAGSLTAIVGPPGTRAALPLHHLVAAARDRIAPPPTASRAPDAWPMTARGQLTPRGRAALAFERLTWRRPGRRDAAVRDLFDLSPTRYAQQLNELIDHPAALRAEPQVVHRLRRLRDARRAERRCPSVTSRPSAGPLLPVRSATA